MPSGIYNHKSHPKIKLICQTCEKEFYAIPSKKNRKFCSKECYRLSQIGKKLTNEHKRKIKENHRRNQTKKTKKKISEKLKGKYKEEKSWNWKGGRYKSNNRWYIYKPEHPNANSKKCVAQSRLVAEKCLGRYLTRKEKIHHIGEKYPMGSPENKGDDRPENLYLFPSNSKHAQYHGWKIKPILESNLI